MPIVIPKEIPAFETLEAENIFVMNNERAVSQDIRPIEIAILNLMPTKIETETQLLRSLANSPLQINVTFITTETYIPKNIEKSHLDKFYTCFSDIKHKKFDGMIITGAPVEKLDFCDVEYWEELKQIMDFSNTNVTSSIYICWGAQAALNHFYKIKKHLLPKKVFGVFEHKKMVKFESLLNGIDDVFYVPHSRHTKILNEDIKACKEIIGLCESKEAGISIIKSIDNKKVFITGHLEYDKYTLKDEYERDLKNKQQINEPVNYFKNGKVVVKWRSTANILFTNWLNYYVYQATPYSLDDIGDN